MNKIAKLLEQVRTTAQLPDPADVADVIDRGTTVQEKRQAREQVMRAAKRIVNALDAGLPDQARSLAEDTAEGLAHLTKDGGDEHTARALAERITATEASGERRNRPSSAPLRNTILTGANTGGIRADDLDEFELDRNATDEQRAAWREQVLETSRQVSRLHAAGDLAGARRLAAERALDHAGMLDVVEHRDPLADVDDPRLLADAIRRGPHDLPAA